MDDDPGTDGAREGMVQVVRETGYLWIVEWEDRFVRPQRIEVRHVTRLEGVTDADLERHLLDVAVPAQARVATRVGGVRRQVLLRCSGERSQTGGFGNSAEGVAVALGDVGVVTATNTDLLWRSEDPVAEEIPT